MFLKRNTCLFGMLLFSLTVWFESTSAGSSFLSPSQKPQVRRLGCNSLIYLCFHRTTLRTWDQFVTPVSQMLYHCLLLVKQSRTKPSRAGRQAMSEPSQPSESNQFTVSTNNLHATKKCTFCLTSLSSFGLKQIAAPLELGITMREEDFEESGVSLQEVVQHLLGYTWTAGLSALSKYNPIW